ncbi:DUF298-domain-containing protein [Fistulina hepatica ATCC 64428]|uniref:Defective in cullin neddylation protein n=1 Tax=Fistulina hepatica ATCC 64428 TaxID=1128425 RepID=A0A0D7ACE7_9AGAR|nr:DUF298-domain-containing protein [Fistulina hepatica ATCC 64428]
MPSEEAIVQFCSITGASVRDAKKLLDKYRSVEAAIDVYYSNPPALSNSSPRRPPAPSTSKLNNLYDKYKGTPGDHIGAQGTIDLCVDLGVDPEDVVMLAVAYELKSPRLGEWHRQGWIDGWKALGCDALPAMREAVESLRSKLSSNLDYFRKVYMHTFQFARADGQRSLPIDMAAAFWGLLIPCGVEGGALEHVNPRDDDDDEVMSSGDGWAPQYLQWWLDFHEKKGTKGISKDTWSMFLEFILTIDLNFETYDQEAAWPSAIDDFVEYAKARLASGGA